MKKPVILIFLILTSFNIVFAQNSDTVTTPSGLKYIIIEKHDGIKAEEGKAVEVHYTGYLLDGKVFDSSLERNEPIEFVLGSGMVIKGWEEGIALMNTGDKMRLIIPPDLAYGKKGSGGVIPPDATLVFDVELLSVNEPKIPISDMLLLTCIQSDVSVAVNQYRELKSSGGEKYNFKESQLNSLGYQLLQLGKTKDAIVILQLNAEVYPNSANVYDSLGEAYMIDGNRELAVQNYNKSLELNPRNDNARKMLENLAK
ncbi:MAG: FKBP-type peptidyl-prolyl cis-trans isomerase [Bacteroidetes bacterium]|nr:FKBP-type peptidyl-prolyl cis-trans isomerase [Bacteroidota bacterium]